jgi:hypothetical protein
VVIEVDEIDNPEATILGVDVTPKQLANSTQKVNARVSIFNARRDTYAMLKAFVQSRSDEEVYSELIYLPANEITEAMVSIDRNRIRANSNIIFRLSDIPNELTQDNNSFAVYYPIPDTSTPVIHNIIFLPADKLGKDEKLRLVANVDNPNGKEIAEYKWYIKERGVRDEGFIPLCNKPSFAYNLARLDLGTSLSKEYEVRLTVTDTAGSTATSTASFTVYKGFLRTEVEPIWNLVSIPAVPVSSIRETLGNLEQNGFYIYAVQQGGFSTGFYTPTQLRPEEGYWLYSNNLQNKPLRMVFTPYERDWYEVPVKYGWNLIGQPFNRNIALIELDVFNPVTNETKQFADAVTLGWLNQNFLIPFDNYVQKYKNTTTLLPGKGCWVGSNIEGLKIKFPKTRTRSARKPISIASGSWTNPAALTNFTLTNASISNGILTLSGNNFGANHEVFTVILNSTDGKYSYSIPVAGADKELSSATLNALFFPDAIYDIKCTRAIQSGVISTNVIRKTFSQPKGSLAGKAKIRLFRLWTYLPVGATVTLQETGVSTTVDGLGNYSFSRLPCGTYTLGFEYSDWWMLWLGVTKVTKTVTAKVSQNKVTILDVVLENSW